MGEVYWAIGKYSLAKFYFEKALRLDKNLTEARNNLNNLARTLTSKAEVHLEDSLIKEDQMNFRMKE